MLARSAGASSGKRTAASRSSRARVRTVMAPKSVPVAATPTVPRSITAERGTMMARRSTWKSKAISGTRMASTARTKLRTPAAFPHQIAARGTGETNSPASALSSRSRCQLRASAKIDENAMASHKGPGRDARRRLGTGEKRDARHDGHQNGEEPRGGDDLTGCQLDLHVLHEDDQNGACEGGTTCVRGGGGRGRFRRG